MQVPNYIEFFLLIISAVLCSLANLILASMAEPIKLFMSK